MKHFVLTAACLVLFGTYSPAQSFVSSVVSDSEGGGQSQLGGSNPSTQSSTEGLSRWFNLNTLSVSYRYRNMADSDGFRLFDSGQERFLVDGGFKFDPEGKYSVNVHVSSGRNFNWAYSDSLGDGFWELITPSRTRNSPAQLRRKALANAADAAGNATYNRVSRGAETYVRQLFFSASPIKQLTFEYGGLGIEHGVNTEITSYDDDGYMSGERLRVRDPEHLFLDQIAVTYGYVGDYFQPNFFRRGERLSQSNYHQFLIEKKFGNRLKASADYTWQNRVNTMREAALVQIRESKILNSARLELYQRTNDITLQGETFPASSGFALTGSRSIKKHLELGGGYASVDQHYTVLAYSRALDAVAFSFNGDSYGIGRRLLARANYTVTPYFSLFGFYTHQVATDYYNKNLQGMNFGVTVDFKGLLNEKFHLGLTSSRSND